MNKGADQADSFSFFLGLSLMLKATGVVVSDHPYVNSAFSLVTSDVVGPVSGEEPVVGVVGSSTHLACNMTPPFLTDKVTNLIVTRHSCCMIQENNNGL